MKKMRREIPGSLGMAMRPDKIYFPEVRERLALRFSSKARQRLRSGIRVDFVLNELEVIVRLSWSPGDYGQRMSSPEPLCQIASKRICFGIKTSQKRGESNAFSP